MTIYTLNNRVWMMERQIHDLYCYIKNNSGGNVPETDPVFSSSPAALISQSDIDRWNIATQLQNLQQVTDQDNTTSNSIISTNFLRGNLVEIKSGAFIGEINSSLLSGNRTYSLPNKSGTIALLNDIPSPPDPVTMQSAYNNGNKITNFANAQGDSSYTKRIVAKLDGTIGWEDKKTVITDSATIFPPVVSGYLNLRKTNNLVEMGGSIVINDTYNMNDPFATLPNSFGLSTNTFSDTLTIYAIVSNLGTGAGVYRSGAIILSGNSLYFYEPIPTGGISIEIYQQYTIL